MDEGRSKRSGELRRAIREVRIAHAEREAEQARLELLAEALEGVAEDLPADHEQLLVGILPGQPPRLWVDATSFVVMGRDKRQYQFLKDTRLGRTTLAESANVDAIADAVTRYLAERIVEREQVIEGDWLASAARRSVRQRSVSRPQPGSSENVSLLWGVCGFGLGMIAGMFLLLAYAWFMVD
jgi:hypothetical protein